MQKFYFVVFEIVHCSRPQTNDDSSVAACPCQILGWKDFWWVVGGGSEL